MITTRRSNGFDTTAEGSARGGVDLLERTVAYEETAPSREENLEEAKARMQKNLDKLLNYDRYSAMQAEEQTAAVQDAPAEEKAEAPTLSDDDIRPTSTTMQFGDGDTSQVFNDLEKSKEDSKSIYKLNARGKLVVVLYALVVTVILALIVLNTGVLKSLSGEIASLSETYAAKSSAVAAQEAQINAISADSHIAEVAENDFGMILR